MKCNTQRETSAIFFRKQESYKYAMVDFICMGLLKLKGTQSKREIQKGKFLTKVGFEPGIFRLRYRYAYNCRHNI